MGGVKQSSPPEDPALDDAGNRWGLKQYPQRWDPTEGMLLGLRLTSTFLGIAQSWPRTLARDTHRIQGSPTRNLHAG